MDADLDISGSLTPDFKTLFGIDLPLIFDAPFPIFTFDLHDSTFVHSITFQARAVFYDFNRHHGHRFWCLQLKNLVDNNLN